MAQSCSIRCQAVHHPTSPILGFGTACTEIIRTAHSRMLRKKPAYAVLCTGWEWPREITTTMETLTCSSLTWAEIHCIGTMEMALSRTSRRLAVSHRLQARHWELQLTISIATDGRTSLWPTIRFRSNSLKIITTAHSRKWRSNRVSLSIRMEKLSRAWEWTSLTMTTTAGRTPSSMPLQINGTRYSETTKGILTM